MLCHGGDEITGLRIWLVVFIKSVSLVFFFPGKSLKTLMSKGILQVHPPICDCPGCRISSPVVRISHLLSYCCYCCNIFMYLWSQRVNQEKQHGKIQFQFDLRTTFFLRICSIYRKVKRCWIVHCGGQEFSSLVKVVTCP